MPLIPALCTQCGASLEVESSQEAAVCPYCHTPFITEKAINNYNTITNIGNLHADVVNMNDDRSRDSRVKSGETFIQMGDYSSAKRVFDELTHDCPYDYRGWWGLIKAKSENFTDFNICRSTLTDIESLYKKACTVAANDAKNSMNTQFKSYYITVKNRIDGIVNNGNRRIARITNEFNGRKNILEDRMKELKNEEKSINKSESIIIGLLAIVVIFLSIIGTESFRGFEWVLVFIFCLIVFGIGAGIIWAIIRTLVFGQKAKEINKEISNLNNQLSLLDQDYHKEVESINALIHKAESGY